MKYVLLLSIHKSEEETMVFVSCQNFEKIEAENFRNEILRQISNVSAAEKPSVVVPFANEMTQDTNSVLVISSEVVNTCPIVLTLVAEGWEGEDIDSLIYAERDSTEL